MAQHLLENVQPVLAAIDPRMYAFYASEYPKLQLEIKNLQQSLNEARAECLNLRKQLYTELQRNAPAQSQRISRSHPQSQAPVEVKTEMPWLQAPSAPTKVRDAMQATGVPATPLPKLKQRKRPAEQRAEARSPDQTAKLSIQAVQNKDNTIISKNRTSIIDADFTFVRRKSTLKRPDQSSADLQDNADTPKLTHRKSVAFDESTMIGNTAMCDEIEDIQRRAVEEVATGGAGRRQLRSRR